MRRLFALLLALLLASCDVIRPLAEGLLRQYSPVPLPAATSTPAPTPPPLPSTGVQFTVHVPANTPAGSSIALVLVDELAPDGLNDRKIPMGAAGQNTWAVIVNLPLNALVKYKYLHEGAATGEEAAATGEPVVYRVLRVTLSAKVEDTVAGWTDAERPSISSLGALTGVVRDFTTGRGVPGLIVLAGGQQTLTSWDGSYSFSRLPYGPQRVTAFAPDGAWTTTDGATTINQPFGAFVDLGVNPAKPVNVTFVVSLPSDTDPRAPLKIAGNALQLGDAFAAGAFGPIVADRLPTLVKQADGRWAATIPMYAGMDVRYRYTLGDGFWNAELNADGSRPLRQFIVPEADSTVTDYVAAWRVSRLSPVAIGVAVPADTPPADTVTIQFKVKRLSAPIPMWPDGANHWSFMLYNPLDFTFDLGYRFCRNYECGVADDAATAGENPTLKQFLPTILPQELPETVSAWQWWPPAAPDVPVELPANVAARPDFRAGFELGDAWNARWLTRLDQTFGEIAATGANYVTVPSPWSVDPAGPRIDFDFGLSPLPSDLAAMIASAHTRGLKVALRPNTCRSPKPDCAYWPNVVYGLDWWNAWFAVYRNYLLYHADIAEKAGAEMLYVGDYSLHPMLPGAPEAPPDAEAQWRAIIAEVRQHYHGQLAFTVLLQSVDSVRGMPLFGDALDYIDVRWEAPLGASGTATVAEMQAAAGTIVDGPVFQVLSRFNKATGISPRFLSVAGAAAQCISAVGQPCRGYDDFAPWMPDDGSVALDLNHQSNIYYALLAAVNDRNWVAGFNVWGYYPPVALRDKWLSVRAKPAERTIGAFFYKWTGK